jgi:hypothetical protein
MAPDLIDITAARGSSNSLSILSEIDFQFSFDK